eukprot:TRINITY_DN2466_c0_g1_i2.p1 TRINITY_DN2466_c0_g1~~TRINITY_DN2466_c0_g1_i2.p1  ORF type:complete len:308 (-),score=57.33 TRINITY_DN2466_c0_g1_i2:36-959(-)
MESVAGTLESELTGEEPPAAETLAQLESLVRSLNELRAVLSANQALLADATGPHPFGPLFDCRTALPEGETETTSDVDLAALVSSYAERRVAVLSAAVVQLSRERAAAATAAMGREAGLLEAQHNQLQQLLITLDKTLSGFAKDVAQSLQLLPARLKCRSTGAEAVSPDASRRSIRIEEAFILASPELDQESRRKVLRNLENSIIRVSQLTRCTPQKAAQVLSGTVKRQKPARSVARQQRPRVAPSPLPALSRLQRSRPAPSPAIRFRASATVRGLPAFGGDLAEALPPPLRREIPRTPYQPRKLLV